MAIAIGAVTREALNVGVKAGLDLQKMVEVMKVSTGGSWSLNYMDFMMKARKGMTTSVARPSPTKNIGLKDWELALDFAKAVGAEIPATEFIHNLDTQSLYKALAEEQAR
jgi:3-hydroxyisobutyrate dehydrogenase-like beta-hydroxyacid dehydrogenase